MPALVWSVVRGVVGKVPWFVWPMLALGLLAGAQTLRLEHAKTATATIQSRFDSYKAQIASQAAADQQLAIDALKAAQAANDAAVAARVLRLRRENDELQRRLQEIADVPPSQDGAVSDVLCTSFSRLWRQQACSADRRH